MQEPTVAARTCVLEVSNEIPHGDQKRNLVGGQALQALPDRKLVSTEELLTQGVGSGNSADFSATAIEDCNCARTSDESLRGRLETDTLSRPDPLHAGIVGTKESRRADVTPRRRPEKPQRDKLPISIGYKTVDANLEKAQCRRIDDWHSAVTLARCPSPARPDGQTWTCQGAV